MRTDGVYLALGHSEIVIFMHPHTEESRSTLQRLPRVLMLFLFSLSAMPAIAWAQTHDSVLRDVSSVLQRSAVDWNRGDLDAFATSYKNSPDILFIGRTVRRGYAQMLAAYKTGYPTREKMGVLSFSSLQVQPLDAQFVTATGHFHLERTAAGGGNADGYFLLVLEHTPSGWKIVRDDTTAAPPSGKK